MIDEVLEPSHKHTAQPNGLGTKREESDEWLDIDVANRLLAQNLQRGQDRFLELILRKSSREWGRVHLYSEDCDHCALAILGDVSRGWNFSGMTHFNGSVGCLATIKVWASMAIGRTASCHSYIVKSSQMLV